MAGVLIDQRLGIGWVARILRIGEHRHEVLPGGDMPLAAHETGVFGRRDHGRLDRVFPSGGIPLTGGQGGDQFVQRVGLDLKVDKDFHGGAEQ